MKKALIAGAASVALAAMPVVGVFAADPVEIVDHITLNVNESCTFSTGGASVDPTATIDAGTATTFSDASHAFVVKCNSKAYTVTAVATDLTNASATAHGTISYVANGAYTTAASATPIADDGVWTAVLTGGDADATIKKLDTTNGNVIKSGNATTTDNFSVSYKALAGAAQNQGQYSGTVTYTLTGTNS
ncbi:hypothetical protein IJJ36_01565 [Candidatus Saccharibacteria bacterium]|nr:hypothetical protein [Candidatus Saccharibacteria bacterium]MBQ6461103.1 hypothetical protein [Candidatus Saccharibacteria bacterium]